MGKGRIIIQGEGVQFLFIAIVRMPLQYNIFFGGGGVSFRYTCFMCRSKTEVSDFVVVAYILVDIIMFHQFRQQTIFISPYLEKNLTFSTTNLFSYLKDAPQSIAPYILSTTVGE